MRKLFVFFVVITLLTSLSGCREKNEALLGDWAVVSQGTSRFGYMLRFERDGRMYCAPEGNNGAIRSVDEEFHRMRSYYTISYKVKNGDTVELVVTVFGAEATLKIDYRIDGDVLTFDGGTYRRLGT